MKRIVLVRHIGSTRASENRFGRRYDADIDELKLNQINGTSSYLSGIAPCKVLSSPARRCISSAYLVYSETVADIIPEFLSYHSGFFEDKEESWVRKNYPRYYNSTFCERFLSPQYGEESIAEQYQRCLPGISREIEQPLFDWCVLFTHFSIIQIVTNHLMFDEGLDSIASGKFPLKEGQYLTLSFSSNQWEIQSSNNSFCLPSRN